MFSSKAGVPKKRLRLHVNGQEEPYQFSFTSPPAIADQELEKFKTLLAAVVSYNTTGAAPPATSKTPNNTSVTPGSPSPSIPTGRPSPSPYSRSPSSAPSRNGGKYSFEVYQKVLTKTPELAELHRELVESGQITEQEFWEGREVCNVLEAAWDNKTLNLVAIHNSTCSTLKRQLPRKGKANHPRLWFLVSKLANTAR